jgi:predicted DNA-binding transcriptional regulator YafY
MSLKEKMKLIKEAIAKGRELEIVYLKNNDEKSIRTILPEYLGEMEYMGIKFMGVRAFCYKKNELRNFRIDKILSLRLL